MFEKTEWYIVILAALTMALIYNVAAGNLINTGSGAVNSLLNTVMGRNSSGTFQKPF